jgi:hypothetical protein
LCCCRKNPTFPADIVEKVLHLLNLLNTLHSHPFLKGKFALKGGSALNLFVFNIPRLSVDIDLNYIGAVEREEMLEDRPKVEQALGAVFSREGFTVKRIPIEHAGGEVEAELSKLYRTVRQPRS